ncbi:MAG TPA: hypothetical protein VKK81_10655 [Candidatus Binatia bacterium]|nr:hypothetical protein [Candidatus Binatia bacterium]
MSAQERTDQTIQRLEGEWKAVCTTLDEQERALVETYLGFLRHVARTCLERNLRVWFRPNQWTHWGEGGFGNLFILLPKGELEPQADLPSEIRLLTDLPEGKTLGEEITLTTLDRITYQPDRWS